VHTSKTVGAVALVESPSSRQKRSNDDLAAPRDTAESEF
jgi:hypothetical protein